MAPPPRLIHPIQIQLTRIDYVDGPAADPQFGGNVSKPVYQDPIQITAQMSYGVTEQFNQRATGNWPQSNGHATIFIPLWNDEVGDGSKPKPGDRITQLYCDQLDLVQTVDLTINRVENRGHYFGRDWLWFCFFQKLFTGSQEK